MPRTTQLYSRLKKLLHAVISGFLQSKPVKQFAAKYPKAYQFFLDRFSLEEFTGLPLTFLLLSFLANLMLLDKIVDAFVHIPAVIAIDQAFAKLMFSLRVPWLVEAFYYFSKLGTFWGVVNVGIVSIAAFIITKRAHYILPVIISVLGADYTMILAKKYFHRTRPEEFWFYHEVDYSFPSGHATIAVAFYGALFYALIRTRKRYASKFRWMIVAILFIGLLGFSRLYLCVHYLSDVLAGYSLGLLWLLLSISINEWTLHRKKRKVKR